MEPDMNTGEGVRVWHGGEEGASDMGARHVSGRRRGGGKETAVLAWYGVGLVAELG